MTLVCFRFLSCMFKIKSKDDTDREEYSHIHVEEYSIPFLFMDKRIEHVKYNSDSFSYDLK